MRKGKVILAAVCASVLALAIPLVACGPVETGSKALYTVAFETAGGTKLPAQGVYDGERAVRPADPEKAGYNFGAWFKNEALTDDWDFDADAVSADTTLYAKWALKPVTEDRAFYYGYNADGETYRVWAKDVADVPETLVLPSEKDGVAVTAVAENGFSGAAVQTLVIPDGIMGVERQAFRNCAELTTILGAEHLTNVGSYAFFGTGWLAAQPNGMVYLGTSAYTFKGTMISDYELTLKDGTTSVSGAAFEGQSSLTKVNFQQSLRQIGAYAFSGTGLREITLPNTLAIIEDSAFRMTPGLETVTVSEGVKQLGGYTFAGSGVKELAFNAVDCETNNAFEGCAALTTVTFGDAVKTVPAGIFNGCTALASAVLGEGITEIPAGLFRDCVALETVAFGANLTVIGDNAFRNTGLKTLTIPENMVKIGGNAFADCAALTSVKFDAVKVVAGDRRNPIFGNCQALASVSFGAEVTEIPDYLCFRTSGVSAVTFGSKIERIGKRAFYQAGVAGELVIPNSVTELGAEAFAENAKLTAVTIGEGVIKAGSGVFYKCAGIKNIAFNAVDLCDVSTSYTNFTYAESINLFGQCNKVSEVTFGDKVKTIPEQFLHRATASQMKLVSVTFPASLERIGHYAFNNCSLLAAVGFNDNLAYIGRSAFAATAWNTAATGAEMQTGPLVLGKVLYKYKQNPAVTKLAIPEGIKSIAANAFQGASALTSVTIPGSVEEIGESAFANLSNLVSVTFSGQGLKRIDDRAFQSCRKLAEFALPDGIEEIGDSAFAYCTALTITVFPASLTVLGNSAYSGSGLTSLTLNDRLTEIPDMAFSSVKLSTLTLPETLKKIGQSAFTGLQATELTLPDSLEEIGSSAFSGGAFTSILFGKGIAEIGDGAFQNCTKLTAVALPDSVTKLGDRVFSDCTALKTAQFSESLNSTGNNTFQNCTALESVVLPEKLETVGSQAFMGTNALTGLTLPATVRQLLPDAFNGMGGLTEIEIPTGVTEIPMNAFKSSKNLVSVTLPDTVTVIGESAFYECSKLASIDLPAGVTSIGKVAFRACTSLREVVIPASVTSIFDNTFMLSTNILAVKFLSEIPVEVTANSFTSMNAAVRFYVPNGSVADYRSNSLWEKYADNVYSVDCIQGDFAVDNGTLVSYLGSETEITLPDTVASVKLGAIPAKVTSVSVNDTNAHLKDVDGNLYSKDGAVLVRYNAAKTDAAFTIPAGVTEIAPYAFANETDLTEIDLSAITKLGEGAFYGCSKLANVTLNETLTELPDFVFYNCAKITSIAIPDTVKRIGNSALYGARLAALTLPTSLEAIGDYAFFSYYNAFEELTIPAGVTEIGDFAFQSNGKLFNVFFKSNTPPELIGTKGVYSSFLYTRADLLLIVPNGDAYRSAESWKSYAGKVVSESAFTRGGATIENDVLYRYDGAGSEGVYAIPDEVTRIGDGAFYKNADITELTVGKGVRNVGVSAFSGMTKLATVHFNAIQIASGDRAFYNMSSIKTVTFGDEVTIIPAGLFESCSGIAELTIPESVQAIGANAFYRAGGLKTLNYNAIFAVNADAVSGAFSMASQLKTVTIGAAVKALPNAFLNNITAVTSVSFADGSALKDIGTKAFNGLRSAKFTGIPASVESYGENAFYGCSLLDGTLDLSAARAFGAGAFQNCAKLSFVNIPAIKEIPKALFSGCKLLTNYDFTGVETVGESAFSNSGLVQVVLPETVKTVGYAAFSGTAITSVTVPGSVEFLDDNVFTNCASLTEAVLAEGVTELPNAFFSGCVKLASVTLPNSLTKIGKQAFMRCTALTEIAVPAAVTEIGQSAFVRSGLTTITLRGTVPPALTTPVFTVSDTLRIVVPQTSLTLYQEEWGDYADNIVAAQE